MRRIWDPQTGQIAAVLHGDTDRLKCVAVCPRGDVIAIAGEDSRIRLWDVRRGEGDRPVVSLCRTIQGRDGPINSLAFSPDGTRLAVAGRDACVKVWDVATGIEAISLDDIGAMCPDVTFSPDGRCLAAAEGGAVRTWTVDDGPLSEAARR